MSTTHRKYDVFLSFRGFDTRSNFISYFYRELTRSNIRTFKDDKELESGQTISLQLIRAIEASRFAVVVVSVNYAASPWCLEELVKIMDLRTNGLIEVIPIFYGMEPSHVRWKIGLVAEQFKKHEDREKDLEKVRSWRQALNSLANISGYCSSKWEDDSEMIKDITDKISKRLLIKIQGQSLSSQSRLRSQKVLLVADDVNKVEQFDALAKDFNWFGPGSLFIIATQDKLVYKADLLNFKNVGDLFRQSPFKKGDGELFRQSAFKERNGELFRQSTFKERYGELFRQLAFKERDGELFRQSNFKVRDGEDGEHNQPSKREMVNSELVRQSTFKEKRDSAAFESDVEFVCSLRVIFRIKL